MNTATRFFLWPAAPVAAALALAAIAGCGGAGTTGLTSPGIGANPTTATRAETDGTTAKAAALPANRVGLFLSVAPAEKGAPGGAYDHIWVTILKVETVDSANKATAVFDDPQGAIVDLATLRDTNGQRLFLPLAAAPVAGGKAIQRINLTFARSLELFAPGSNVGQMTPLADTIASDSEGRPVLSFPLTRPRDLGNGKQNVVVDFDVARFAVKEGRVTPALREGSGEELADLRRQVGAVWAGTVADVASSKGSDGSFTLNLPGDNRSVVVQTGTGVALFNDGNTPNPALTAGGRVEVRGVLSPDTKRLVASQIRVFADKGGDTSGACLWGNALQVSRDAGTLALKPVRVGGGLAAPTQSAVTVTIAPDAVLRSRGGLLLTADDFYATLKAAGSAAPLRVAGVFDPVNGTLKATRVSLEEPSPVAGGHEADVEGTVLVADSATRAFTLSAPLAQWNGLLPPVDGKTLTVTTTAATTFADEKGAYLAGDHFFTASAPAAATPASDSTTPAAPRPHVHITGIYANGILTATRAQLVAAPVVAPAPAPVASTAAPVVTDKAEGKAKAE